MTSVIWKPHVTVAAVGESDGRFLMVEERSDQGLVLNQPAGHLEDNESLEAAVVREAREETGRDFEVRALLGFYLWKAPDGTSYLRAAFAGRWGQAHPEHVLDTGIERTLWLSRAELAQDSRRLRSPLVLRCVDDYLAGSHHPLGIVRHVL